MFSLAELSLVVLYMLKAVILVAGSTACLLLVSRLALLAARRALRARHALRAAPPDRR